MPAQINSPHLFANAEAGAVVAQVHSAAGRHPLAALAVVIPVGPGDDSWPALLADLGALPPGAEICLVTCAPASIPPSAVQSPSAAQTSVQWQLAAQGRALQQNTGAGATQNPWLWFVHADSRLGPTTLAALARFMRSSDIDRIGFFDLAFHDGPALMRLNACGAWLRSRLFGIPFGDQGLLMSRATFDRLGGFDEGCAYAEDHAMIWQAKRLGIALRAAGAPLYTSARKYTEHGWLSTTARHLIMTWQQARVFSRQLRGRLPR